MKPLIYKKGEKAYPAGLEPATNGLEIRCSIQLSYGYLKKWYRWWDSNPHEDCSSTDFKSVASAISPHRHWWDRRDSNPQPRDYESPALTIELQAFLLLRGLTICCSYRLMKTMVHKCEKNHYPIKTLTTCL